MSEILENVERHYARRDLAEIIFQALADAGYDRDKLDPEDLAAIDEFHVRGRAATIELADRLAPSPGCEVLDVGSGLGGASRYLAAKFGCRTTGLDLTEAYCRVSTLLAERTGLSHLVNYRQGNALDMPFPDGAFDAVWSQHVSMNIADKAGLYTEMARVVRPGGKLAIYDILAGAGGKVHFPVPWAREPENSFLITPAELRRTLESAGFEILAWRDTTQGGLAWFQGVTERIREKGLPPLGLHLLMGPDFAGMARNLLRNLEENRIALIELVGRCVPDPRDGSQTRLRAHH